MGPTVPPKILLIDDDPTVGEAVRGALRGDPFEVMVATTAADGSAMALASPPDLILLDLFLPDADGFDVLSRFKEDFTLQEIPILLITANAGLSEKVRGFELGAVDYITKPFEVPELKARIRSVVKSKLLQDQLHRLNVDLVVSRQKAEASSKAKSDFLSVMSHEIRTPLNAIIGMTRLLMDSGLDNSQRELAETIRASGDVLLAVVNDILDFSKIEAGDFKIECETMDLNGCLEEILDLHGHRACEKGLELLSLVEPGVPAKILCDASRLRQVLGNLVSNAIKFTEKGEVLISVREGNPLPNGNPSLQFTVSDTGIGIPTSKFDALFKKFSQIDSGNTRQFGGTGLGLAICKSLVARMGGSIWVESRQGVGSSFHFTIPREQVQEEALAGADAGPSLDGSELLLISENSVVRDIMSKAAARFSASMTCVGKGPELLAATRRNWTSVIVDLALGSGASAVCLMLGSQLKETIPILAIGSQQEWAQLSADETRLIRGLIPKPVKQSTLVRVLAENRSQSPDGRPAHPPVAVVPEERPRLKLLVVDDNAINQKVFSKMLQQLKHDTIIASNGLEAVVAFEKEAFDAVFMDLQMPVMDGFEATRHIRALEKTTGATRTPIIAVTANVLTASRDKCCAAGMDDFLTKPVRIERVQQALEEWGASLKKGLTETGADGVNEPKPASKDPAEEPPLDIERLRELTDGSPEALKDLMDLFITQTAQQLKDLRQAHSLGASEQVRKLAHCAAGASATCGANKLANLLRSVENAILGGDLVKPAAIIPSLELEFERAERYLAEMNR